MDAHIWCFDYITVPCDFARLMFVDDLRIGTGGLSAYERTASAWNQPVPAP